MAKSHDRSMPLKRTGTIWSNPPNVRGQIVRRVCEALEEAYGHPRFGNPEEPLDDLVYIVLSNKTSPQTAQRVYEHLRMTYGTWDDVLRAPPRQLRALIAPAGLSTVKSRQIREAFRKIEDDFGSCNLSALRGKNENEVEKYLTSLAGVSEKVAKCIMIYTLGANVLPVDSHVHRVTRRLGWISWKRADQSHDELEALVPPRRRATFHVDCIAHGREICRPTQPRCDRCCINRHCKYFRSHQ